MTFDAERKVLRIKVGNCYYTSRDTTAGFRVYSRRNKDGSQRPESGQTHFVELNEELFYSPGKIRTCVSPVMSRVL